MSKIAEAWGNAEIAEIAEQSFRKLRDLCDLCVIERLCVLHVTQRAMLLTELPLHTATRV